MAQGKSYTSFFFPFVRWWMPSIYIIILYILWNLMIHIFHQIFHKRMPSEAVDLVSRLLQYSPNLRCTAVSIKHFILGNPLHLPMIFVSSLWQLEALVHPFFDELRDPNSRLPNGRSLPHLFNFKPNGKFMLFLHLHQLKPTLRKSWCATSTLLEQSWEEYRRSLLWNWSPSMLRSNVPS